MATSEKGTQSNPYTMQEFEALADAGTWSGGYVTDESGVTVYMMAEVEVLGYSGYSGYGSGGSGSDVWWGTHLEGYSGSINIGDDGSGINTNGNNYTGINNQVGGEDDGGGGHHNTGNSQTNEFNVDMKEYPILHEMLKTVNKISTGIRSAIHSLNQMQKFQVDSYITEDGEQKHAYYNQDEKKLYVASDTGIPALVHEITHYFQDEKNLLDYDNSASNNEFQAEFLTDIISLAMGENVDSVVFQEKFDFSENEYNEFSDFILANTKHKDHEVKLKGNNIENYLNNFEQTSGKTWEERMQKYVSYFRNRYQDENTYKSHKKDSNPNYQWDWSGLIGSMNFKRY